MATAKNRALDRLRQNALHARKHEELGRDLEAQQAHVVPDFVDALGAAQEDAIGDDLLRLVFTACHPVLSTEARVALTLRLLGGLTTDEIARAFLVPEATIAQRIVRAKRTLGAAKVPFEVPGADQLAARLASVLGVIYLIFNEGYSATAGDDWMRPALCAEALRLGRIVAELVPARPRCTAGRADGAADVAPARAHRCRGPAGAAARPGPRPLGPLLIRRGMVALARSEALGGARGPYALQAALAACHARAATAAPPTGCRSSRSTTRWPRSRRRRSSS
jgi:predicted RNA polymerase sigma factor